MKKYLLICFAKFSLFCFQIFCEAFRKEGFRIGWIQERSNSGEEGCRKEGMLDRRNTGKVGCKTGVMQDTRDTGDDRCRKVGI